MSLGRYGDRDHRHDATANLRSSVSNRRVAGDDRRRIAARLVRTRRPRVVPNREPASRQAGADCSFDAIRTSTILDVDVRRRLVRIESGRSPSPATFDSRHRVPTSAAHQRAECLRPSRTTDLPKCPAATSTRGVGRHDTHRMTGGGTFVHWKEVDIGPRLVVG